MPLYICKKCGNVGTMKANKIPRFPVCGFCKSQKIEWLYPLPVTNLHLLKFMRRRKKEKVFKRNEAIRKLKQSDSN